MAYYTVHDGVAHLLDFIGNDPSAEANRRARRAVAEAYRDLTNAYAWSYFLRQDRIALDAPQTSSTITYDHTGGAAERLVTIAAGTWPTWAKYGRIIIAGVSYEVESNPTTTTLTLTATSNPGADVAGGTSYTLYRDTYQLPADFLAMDLMYEINNTQGMDYIKPTDFLLSRKDHNAAGSPQVYSIFGDLDEPGRMVVRFAPYPSAAGNLDFIYKRRPRDLRLHEYRGGYVTTSSGSANITGTNTAFLSTMAGSIIRINPTGEDFGQGSADSDNRAYERMMLQNRFVHERRIITYTSATALVADSTIPETLTDVKYLISDPIDIELGAMQTAFERLAEKHFATIMRDPRASDAASNYPEALELAIRADQRCLQYLRDTKQGLELPRAADMPTGPGRGGV